MALYARELKTAVVKMCSWGTVETCGVKHSELKKKVPEIGEKFERVFLGPKWGYDKVYYSSSKYHGLIYKDRGPTPI